MAKASVIPLPVEPKVPAAEVPAEVSNLLELLSHRRPHGKAGEDLFFEEYIAPLDPLTFHDDKGEALAYAVHLPGNETMLFSCHIDTVHFDSERQVVLFDAEMGWAYKDDKAPLGADDGAGIWLLLEMIKAGIAGTYIFHRGEERGCIGSRGMAKHHDTWLKQFTHAIAFDRRGTTDVITHQATGQCCSQKFAHALSKALNEHGYSYAPDDGGIYTDTAEYVDIIHECTNVSCGYEGEHSPSEMLDVYHLMGLRDACLQLDWAALPIDRQPGEDDGARWAGFGLPLESLPVTQGYVKGELVTTESLSYMTYEQVYSWVLNAKAADIADLLYEQADMLIECYDTIAKLEHENDRY